ncbi:MAG: FkbM family methyltransferase, partial [Cytophagales bacterium]|nr:FkbM family methyltransferase [Cytophagales bacterium]
IDAGANIGMSTVWLAERYPEARIFAIEPDSANYELLAANTAVYGERVTAFNGGIWPEAGRLEIENPEAGAQHFRTRETSGASSSGVEALTVPDILERTGTETILYMKVDIEGSQKELFARNTEWVAKTHLISIELDDWLLPWAGTSRPFLACLNGYKFDYLLQGENLVCFQDTSDPS